MRKFTNTIFLIALVAVVISGCSRDIIHITRNPDTGKSMERLNIKHFNRVKDSKSTLAETIVTSEKSPRIVEVRSLDGLSKTNIFSISDGYMKTFYYFEVHEGVQRVVMENSQFDTNGIQKYKRKYLHYKLYDKDNNFIIHDSAEFIPIGIWEVYDANGRILQTVDYDSGYTFTIKDVLDYINSSDLQMFNKGFGIEKLNALKQWRISYKKAENDMLVLRFIILDGKTGELVQEGITPRSY